MDSGSMRVLVAIDGSEPAALGVDLVANVAWPGGTEILVAEAVETGAGLFGGPWPALANVQADRIEAEIRAEAERTVHRARERLARPGLTVQAAVLRGRAATAIVDRAGRMPADLIVVGSRGQGTIASMLLGSVSAELVDHSPAPVLVARGDDTTRVVLAWDGSSCASRAADLVCTSPIFAGSAVRVVSVADVEIPWWTGCPVDGSPALRPIYARRSECLPQAPRRARSPDGVCAADRWLDRRSGRTGRCRRRRSSRQRASQGRHRRHRHPRTDRPEPDSLSAASPGTSSSTRRARS